MTDPRHALGLKAEQAVSRWLTACGWQVLERRLRTRWAELDLVCLDPGEVLVGVEVRARRTARAGSAAESIDPRAVRRRALALAAYARESGLRHPGLRIDLVTVTPAGQRDGRWVLARVPGIESW